MEISQKDRETVEFLYMWEGFKKGIVSTDVFMKYIEEHSSDTDTADTTGMSREEIISEILDKTERIKKNLHEKYCQGGEDHGREERPQETT